MRRAVRAFERYQQMMRVEIVSELLAEDHGREVGCAAVATERVDRPLFHVALEIEHPLHELGIDAFDPDTRHLAVAARREHLGVDERLHRDHVGIESHPHVVIGAEQDGPATVANGDGRRFHPLHDQVEWVGQARRKQHLTLLYQRVELGKQVVHQALS